MKIVETYTVESNFWDEFPQLTTVGPFKKLYKSDKTPNKAYSSKLIWTIVFIWDYNSKFYNLPEDGEDGKIKIVFEEFFGDPKYYEKNIEKVEELKDFYLRIQETPARRALRDIEDKLRERAKFLKDTKYDMGVCNERGQWVGNTASILDKMMADTKKIYDLYDQALKTVSKEQLEDERVRGGGELSLSDKEEI
jgi:hypothetical protein